jgi:putative tricarboxylic transport membrane protein
LKNLDRLSAAFFFLLSVAICLFALQLPGGTLGTPGPMVFPLLLGLSLLALSLSLFAQSKSSPLSSDANIFPKGEVLKVLYVLGAFFLSFLIFDRMGFVISIFVLLALLFKGTGGKTTAKSILYGLIISLAAYVSFHHLLGVRLPKGILGFW